MAAVTGPTSSSKQLTTSVQTTTAQAAQKLKAVTPNTLRVTEPKRRQPPVKLHHIEGEGDMKVVYPALHEQSLPLVSLRHIEAEVDGSTLAKLQRHGVDPGAPQTQSKVAFEKRSGLDHGGARMLATA